RGARAFARGEGTELVSACSQMDKSRVGRALCSPMGTSFLSKKSVLVVSFLLIVGASGHLARADEPYVDPERIPPGSPGFSELRVADADLVPEPSSIGNFRISCDYSHMKFDDPIVYPGEPGRSHLHAFFGNTEADAFSTADSLANEGNST